MKRDICYINRWDKSSTANSEICVRNAVKHRKTFSMALITNVPNQIYMTGSNKKIQMLGLTMIEFRNVIAIEIPRYIILYSSLLKIQITPD